MNRSIQITGEEHRSDWSENPADGDELAEPIHRTVNTVLVQRLGEADYDKYAGLIGFLNLMAGSGASLPEGVVLTHEFHLRFLNTGGFAEAIRASVGDRGDVRQRVRALRRKYGRLPIEGELNRMICDAIIGLGSRSVVVISEDVSRAGLRTIPEVRDAVRKSWLSVGGLKRQLEAAAGGEEIPTWPVLIQRESHYYEPRVVSSSSS